MRPGIHESSRLGMCLERTASAPFFFVQALHEIAGSIHVDLKPQQLLIDETGRVMVNDFNSAHIMSVARDGTLCPVQSAKRRRPTPWPAPENYEGKVSQK